MLIRVLVIILLLAFIIQTAISMSVKVYPSPIPADDKYSTSLDGKVGIRVPRQQSKESYGKGFSADLLEDISTQNNLKMSSEETIDEEMVICWTETYHESKDSNIAPGYHLRYKSVSVIIDTDPGSLLATLQKNAYRTKEELTGDDKRIRIMKFYEKGRLQYPYVFIKITKCVVGLKFKKQVMTSLNSNDYERVQFRTYPFKYNSNKYVKGRSDNCDSLEVDHRTDDSRDDPKHIAKVTDNSTEYSMANTETTDTTIITTTEIPLTYITDSTESYKTDSELKDETQDTLESLTTPQMQSTTFMDKQVHPEIVSNSTEDGKRNDRHQASEQENRKESIKDEQSNGEKIALLKSHKVQIRDSLELDISEDIDEKVHREKDEFDKDDSMLSEASTEDDMVRKVLAKENDLELDKDTHRNNETKPLKTSEDKSKLPRVTKRPETARNKENTEVGGKNLLPNLKNNEQVRVGVEENVSLESGSLIKYDQANEESEDKAKKPVVTKPPKTGRKKEGIVSITKKPLPGSQIDGGYHVTEDLEEDVSKESGSLINYDQTNEDTREELRQIMNERPPKSQQNKGSSKRPSINKGRKVPHDPILGRQPDSRKFSKPLSIDLEESNEIQQEMRKHRTDNILWNTADQKDTAENSFEEESSEEIVETPCISKGLKNSPDEGCDSEESSSKSPASRKSSKLTDYLVTLVLTMKDTKDTESQPSLKVTNTANIQTEDNVTQEEIKHEIKEFLSGSFKTLITKVMKGDILNQYRSLRSKKVPEVKKKRTQGSEKKIKEDENREMNSKMEIPNEPVLASQPGPQLITYGSELVKIKDNVQPRYPQYHIPMSMRKVSIPVPVPQQEVMYYRMQPPVSTYSQNPSMFIPRLDHSIESEEESEEDHSFL